MSKVTNIQEFYGGKSSDDSIGTPASFGYSLALDHRTKPSQLSVLPGARQIGTPQDLIQEIFQVPNGERYTFGDQGYVGKIGTNNVLTYVNKLSSGAVGAMFRQDTDAAYFATTTTIERLYPISGTPTFGVSLAQSKSTDSNAYRTGGTNSYTVPTTIDETAYCSFLPDIEPFYSIKVNILNKGTGNWTLTLHDGLNNTLATVTKTNADISSGLTEFVFSSQIRALVKPNARTYHFHLTSTATGTVACSTANDLNTADFELWAYRLVNPTNGLHPMIQFQQFICIGNERYLAVWEPLSDSPPNNEFQRHRLTFPPGFQVCGLAVTDEFLVIATEKRSTDSSRDFQEGKLFIWDGTAQTYNQIIDVAGGSPQGISTHENFPYFVVNGFLCAWPGGKNIVKVRSIANVNSDYSDTSNVTTVYPNMLTTRKNRLLVGFPSNTLNQEIEHGVYEWGSIEKNYPSSWGYSYLTSTGTQYNNGSNDLRIGCVKNFGDELYISWEEDGAFGLDLVDSDSDPAPVAKFRSRHFDAGAVFKPKLAVKLGITTKTLPAGVTLTPVYSIDNGADVLGTPMTSGTQVVIDIPEGRFYSIEYGFNLTCEGTEPPEILSVALEWEPLLKEKSLG